MSDSPGSRVREFRKSLPMSQRAFAASLGFSGGLVGQIEANLAAPSAGFVRALSSVYRVSADWVLHGTGEMLLSEIPGFAGRQGRIDPPSSASPAGGDFRFEGEEFAMIRRMELSVSSRRGLEPAEGAGSEALAFSRNWLSRHQINSDLAVLVRVSGDGMAPAIPDGSLVMVHLPEMRVEREGVYAFTRDHVAHVKRLVPSRRDGGGKLHSLAIISDNPTHPPEVVSGEALSEIRVIGRVRCVLTTL